MKKGILTLCCIIMAIALAGCSGNTNEIRDEVKQLLGVDQDGEALIAAMFEEFDEAWNTLAADDSISDDDLGQYANKIYEAYSSFSDVFDEKYEVDSSTRWEGEERERMSDILSEYSSFNSDAITMILNSFDYLTGEISGEVYCEETIGFVNSCSMFFYGTNWLTQDDLDKLADKLV